MMYIYYFMVNLTPKHITETSCNSIHDNLQSISKQADGAKYHISMNRYMAFDDV